MVTFSAPTLIISVTLTTLFLIINVTTPRFLGPGVGDVAVGPTTLRLPTAGDTSIDITTLGATANGETDSSEALLSAWDLACRFRGSSSIVIPDGLFLVSTPVRFSGHNCNSSGVTFDIKGRIVGPSNFKALANSRTWIAFDAVSGVTISGGTFDAKGATLWACKKSGNACPHGASTLRFTNSMNIEINGVTSTNSQLFHIIIYRCKNVKVQDVKVFAPQSSPNTDGIHVEKSTGITILNSNIGTGDDCVSIGQGTTNLWIEDIKCGPGHGISIGSLGRRVNETGVQNITVKTITFTGSDNGIRIKSWGRSSNGYVRNALFEHITMVNTKNPIVINQNYCNSNKGCALQASGVKITDVIYRDIHGTSATPFAVKLNCSSEHPCTDIKLEDIKLTYKNKAAKSFCANVVGSTKGIVDPKSCF